MSAPKWSRKIAFSLVEVTLALGIIAFAIVVLMGLLPVGLSASREGSSEESATELLAAAAADIANAGTDATRTPLYSIPLDLPSEVYFSSPGARSQASATNADFRVSVSTRTSANPSLTIFHISVSWPPQASLPTGSVETLVIRATPARL